MFENSVRSSDRHQHYFDSDFFDFHSTWKNGSPRGNAKPSIHCNWDLDWVHHAILLIFVEDNRATTDDTRSSEVICPEIIFSVQIY